MKLNFYQRGFLIFFCILIILTIGLMFSSCNEQRPDQTGLIVYNTDSVKVVQVPKGAVLTTVVDENFMKVYELEYDSWHYLIVTSPNGLSVTNKH